MEIRKADSKGRVTGFEPGGLYKISRGGRGHITISKVVLSDEDWDFVLDREGE